MTAYTARYGVKKKYSAVRNRPTRTAAVRRQMMKRMRALSAATPQMTLLPKCTKRSVLHAGVVPVARLDGGQSDGDSKIFEA